MRTLSTAILALALFACSSGTSRRDAVVESQLSLAELAASNQAKTAKLAVGMSKQDVVSLMGNQTARTRDGIVNNPWTVEAHVGKDGAQYEALYYVIRKNQPFTPVRKSLTTAIVFRNGKLVGWGENAFEQFK